MGKIIAVCTSVKRGTPKTDVQSAVFTAGLGIEGDSHAEAWHRQVSLISADKIKAFTGLDNELPPGAFGENLIVEGIDLAALPVGTLLRCGPVLMEVTQIGKPCHAPCEIRRRTGDCIMPREGIFARVLESGRIGVGDEICVEGRKTPFPWQAAVITLSDKGFCGEREDKSGPAIKGRLIENGYEVVELLLLPDDRAGLEKELARLCDYRRLDLILTTGGTGFSPRDNTPEATLAVADRQAPGIAEAVRAASMSITPRAMLSRAVSVIRRKTLIINLPGSPKACMESMDVFLDTLPHALELLRDQVSDCAQP